MGLTHAFGSEWTRFRGPNGSGLADADIPAEWDRSAFKWKIKLPGTGHGSPVLWDNRIYLLCGDEESGTRIAVCVDAGNGGIRWQKKFDSGNSKRHRFNSVASSTGAVDEGNVYFSWGDKDALNLVALTHNGEIVWEKDLGPVSGGHGFGASPMVYGDLLVLNNDQEGVENGSLLALHKETGEIAWEVERQSQRISYSTPCVYTIPGTGREVLIFTNWTHGFTAVDPADGSVIDDKSVFDQESQERAISSPIVYRDMILGTCGFTNYPKHAVMMRMSGEGKFEEIWRMERSVPHIPSPIIVNDLVFLWDDAGIITCLKPETGEMLWRERVEGKGEIFGSPVSDGKKIFCVDEEGTVSVIEASEKFKLLAQNNLDDVCRSTPAISDGVMFVRTFQYLYAIPGK